MVLIDSSIWVRYLRRGAAPRILDMVRGWLRAGEGATTEIIRAELLQASRTEAEFQKLQEMLDGLHQFPCREREWESVSWNGYQLRRVGVIVPTTDLIIASVAQQAGAILAHADDHYEMVSPHLGLQTVSLR